MTIKKQERQTRLIELVETHNLSVSLQRIKNAPGYGDYKWKRALYHALAMSGAAYGEDLAKLRIALDLP